MASPLTDYLKVQKATDQAILTALRASAASIDSELRRLQSRTGIGAAVRREQLLMTQVAMNREMERLWTRVGDIVEAQKAAAAGVAAEGVLRDSSVLSTLFSAADRDYMARSAAATATRGLEAVERRLEGSSYVPLKESVYNNAALSSGKVDEIVNAALARGASAAELARDVRAYVNPNTPGGVRYASMRLGRTEINNSFHASQIKEAQKSPWVTAVRWWLSGSHPTPDECNEYAESVHFEGGTEGQFKPEDVPAKPHPQCLCYTTPDTVDRDEFIKQFEEGKYDEYLAEQGLPGESYEKVADEVRAAKALTGIEAHSGLARDYGKWASQEASDVQLEAFQRYTRTSAYQRWNPHLRGQAADVNEKDLAHMDALSDLIKDSPPLKSPTNTYRGITDPDQVFGSDSMPSGTIFKDDAFVSTTMDDKVRDYYRGGDGAVIHIRIPEGTRAAVAETEGQIVLNKGTRMRIISDRRVMTIKDKQGYEMLQADSVKNGWTTEEFNAQLKRWRVVEWTRVIEAEVV